MFKKLATPNETRFNDWQWNLFAPTSTYTGCPVYRWQRQIGDGTGGANLPLAWDVTTGNSNVVLAVIDTGIVNHQDLNGAGISLSAQRTSRTVASLRAMTSSRAVGAGYCLPTSLRMTATDAMQIRPIRVIG